MLKQFGIAVLTASGLLVAHTSIGQDQPGRSLVNRSAFQDSAVHAFDRSVAKLPPAFSGHSIVSIFQAVSNRPELLKSEFETEVQYRDRIASLADTKLLGNIPLNGEIAFVVTCDSSDPNKDCERYNAEKGVLSVLLPDNSADPAGVKLYRKLAQEYPQGFHTSPAMSVPIQVREEDGPRIPAGIAENGFGARFPIVKQSVTRYFIDCLIPEWFSLAASNPPLGESNPSIDISLDPQTAKRAKGAVRELIVGHLSPPFVGEVLDTVDSPTRSYPVRTTMHIRTVHIDIDEVWFFNFKTGEVYRKVRSNNNPD